MKNRYSHIEFGCFVDGCRSAESSKECLMELFWCHFAFPSDVHILESRILPSHNNTRMNCFPASKRQAAFQWRTYPESTCWIVTGGHHNHYVSPSCNDGALAKVRIQDWPQWMSFNGKPAYLDSHAHFKLLGLITGQRKKVLDITVIATALLHPKCR